MLNKSFKKKVLFVGIPDMAYLCLEGLCLSGVNIVGVLGPKKDHQTYANFKRFAQLRKLNFIEYDRLDDLFFIKEIRDLKADIAVVCSFNYKVPKILLESVKDGFINVHPSLLPKYRGANPYSSVIIDGETETGVTLHFMDENFDTGDIIVQKKIAIGEKETMGTIFNKTNLLAFNMLLETLCAYEHSELPRIKQSDEEAVKCKIFNNELFLIDFNQSAKEIERFIRSLNPFIIAATNFRQNLVKVFAAEVIEKRAKKEPGTIEKVENDKFYIATKEGLISPTVMQFGSFFIGNAKDFIKILNPKVGEKFQGDSRCEQESGQE